MVCLEIPYTAIASFYSTDPIPVLSHIISQLRPGADLSRITLPTFILEERSMLERITKWVTLIDREGGV
jgi:hypothetical protein